MSSVEHNSGRDLRIDFFRGLSICVIFIDHIERNPFARYTFHRYGWSDAAEAFVFLSGLSCGIAYSGILATFGWRRLASAAAWRAGTLYLCYSLLALATVTLAFASAIRVADHTEYIGYFPNDLGNDPVVAILKSLALLNVPSLPGILVMYILFTLVAVPAFLWGSSRSKTLTLVASGSLWCLMQFGSSIIPAGSIFPFFNPAAWQFLFIIGMYAGSEYRAPSTTGKVRASYAKWAVPAAWTIVLLGIAFRSLPLLFRLSGMDPDAADHYGLATFSSKYDLSPLRLAHFLSVALLIANYIGSNDSLLRMGKSYFLTIGRNPLQTFCASVVLSQIGTLIFTRLEPGLTIKLLYNVSGLIVLGLVGLAMARRNEMKIMDWLRPVAPVMPRPISLPAEISLGQHEHSAVS